MRCRTAAGLLLAVLATAPAHAETLKDHGVTATYDDAKITLANGEVSRTWQRDGLVSSIAGVTGEGPDFTLTLAGQAFGSDDFAVQSVALSPLERRGVRVTMELASRTLPVLTATRTVEAYPGIAGFRTQTTLRSAVPLLLSAVTLDEAHVGDAALPTIHAFRAGADWRGESDWGGPEFGSIGDDHAGDWRDTRHGERGAPLSAPGQWVTADLQDGTRVFSAMETNDFPSTRGLYDGDAASTRLDYTRDVIILGPLEESGHIENPREEALGRGRTVDSAGLALPATFTGVARGAADEGWQWHRYLVEHRVAPYPRDVVFNSDAVDDDVISTGAKDDMDIAAVRQIAPVARALGADVFTLDDGWQAASGDWQPDSPAFPEPRGKYPPRFPDSEFTAVREAIAPMKLGLWMSPMSFNPSSLAFRAHPEWACAPVGAATAAANTLTPDDGSNEAGLGVWGTGYLDFLEARLRQAIEDWDVKLFKFDFLVWLDCAGQNDLYGMHDRFLALIDELRADYPDVAFAIDETNDYRLFPFESTLRGPTWFTNGGPSVAQVLHNTWTMSPWIPARALGQKMLTGTQRKDVATSVAATLLNEQMITEDLRDPAWTDVLVAEARRWVDWGKAHREDYLSGVTYPLLADPLENTWTALQSWDPEERRGALLAFRQDDARETTTVALQNVPDGDYEVRRAPDNAVVGTFSAQELRDGIEVAAPADGAVVVTLRSAP